MPRALRILVEGGLYHVYNRLARGEAVFSDPEEAIEFLDLLRDLKQRDDLQIFAWSLLGNHFHLAVRTSAVPLSRTMRTLQGGYSRAFNRRWGRTGPLWQSRYQTRLVDSQRYLVQLVFYIHLNPVRAGLVEDLNGMGANGCQGRHFGIFYSNGAALVRRRLSSWSRSSYSDLKSWSSIRLCAPHLT